MNGKKHDGDKPRFSLLPPVGLYQTVKVLEHGAKKYGPENWRNLEDGERRYADAILRHTFALLAGETHDPETGIHHGAHIACSGLFLAEGFEPEPVPEPAPQPPLKRKSCTKRNGYARGNLKWTPQEREELLDLITGPDMNDARSRSAALQLFAAHHERTYKAVCLQASRLMDQYDVTN
jgi:hypothetical protein